MRLVFLIVILLIAYGSLFPFDFVALDLSNFDWWEWFFTFQHRTTRGDILGNVLLFIPYGFFGVLSIQQQFSPVRNLNFVALVGIGFLFAILLQIFQIFLPSRVASAGDAIVNLIGLLIGLLVARLISSSVFARWFQKDDLMTHLSIPLILCTCWLGYLWFPFIPSLDWQQFKNSVKPLLDWHSLSGFRIVDKYIAWTLFWMLLEQITPWQQKNRHRWMVLAVVVVGQIVFLRNVMSLNSFIGVTMAIALLQWSKRIPMNWLAGSLLVWIIMKGSYPLNWNEYARPFSWIPFSGFLKGSMWFNSFVLFEKLFFYGAAIFYLHLWLKRWIVAAAVMSSGLLLVEILQIWIGNHRPEITDPLIAVLLSVGLAHLQMSAKVASEPVSQE